MIILLFYYQFTRDNCGKKILSDTQTSMSMIRELCNTLLLLPSYQADDESFQNNQYLSA